MFTPATLSDNSGTPLRPLSRENQPKPGLALASQHTLLQGLHAG